MTETELLEAQHKIINFGSIKFNELLRELTKNIQEEETELETRIVLIIRKAKKEYIDLIKNISF